MSKMRKSLQPSSN